VLPTAQDLQHLGLGILLVQVLKGFMYVYLQLLPHLRLLQERQQLF